MANKITKLVCLVLYYGIAVHLPEHSDPRGKPWKWLRAKLAKPLLRHAGEGFNVNHGVHFGKGDKLSMGKYGALGRDSRVIGTVTMGDYTGTADNVMITTMNRRFDSFDGPMMFQGKRDEKPIVIDGDVMIFARAMILAGVHIHQGCVIGAGAVVTKDVPPWAIVVGNPARVVKFRKNPPKGLDYARMTPIECAYTPEEA